MCGCMCVRTWAGVRSDDDDAVLCSSELAAGFGDEVLLGAGQTCRDREETLEGFTQEDENIQENASNKTFKRMFYQNQSSMCFHENNIGF